MRWGLFAGVAAGGLMLSIAQPSWTADQGIDPLTTSTICSGELAGAVAEGPSVAILAPKMLPGFGNGGFAVRTDRPEAQRWFSYGVELAQAFAHDPAKAAFKEAVRQDPDCALCLWGQAWADGPTINYPITGAERAAARRLAVRALLLAAGGPAKERQLAAAMVRRYAPAGGDKAFAAEMSRLAVAYPDDDAILVIAADALLIAGRMPEYRRAETLLETVLARTPGHTGAIHFYIHASEWIGEAGRAERYADTLATLAPGASHLIHMPSHTYYRVGRYRDAGRANLLAIKVDKAWMDTVGGFDSSWKVPYHGHNVRFAIGGAMMAGDAEAALTIADLYATMPVERLRKSAWAQSSASSAWYAYGRYSDPDKVLAMPAPDAEATFLRAMWHYGRGEALARKGDAAGVRAEAAAVTLTPAQMVQYRGDRLTTVALLEISRQTLIGRAAMIEGRFAEAVTAYGLAADRQDKVFGHEGDPPVWWYPSRRSQAAALLAGGQPDKALKLAQAVLEKWPNDPMGLLVVARAQASLGQSQASGEALAKARAAWSGGPLEAIKLGEI